MQYIKRAITLDDKQYNACSWCKEQGKDKMRKGVIWVRVIAVEYLKKFYT